MPATIALPQNDPDPTGRAAELATIRRQYGYHYAYDDTFANANQPLPKAERPGLRYRLKEFGHALPLLGSLPRLLRVRARSKRGIPPRSYSDYDFFPTVRCPDPFLPLNFQCDRQFGIQRAIGPNHPLLRAVHDRLPLPESLPYDAVKPHFEQVLADVSFDAAYQRGRLYTCDYAMLRGLAASPGDWYGKPQYLTAPAVLLYRTDDGVLRPVAIRLNPAEGDNPIFAPTHGAHWNAAKIFVQGADGAYHQFVTHATRVHYLVEALILGSRRNLHPHHPVLLLLAPHLGYTLKVNSAHLFLKDAKGKRGTFGNLFGGSYEAMVELMAEAFRTYDFSIGLPEDLAARGLEDPALLYPYRDDGMLLWEALRAFVSEYLDLYYATDAEVAADAEIQAWARELSGADGLRIGGFPPALEGREALAAALTRILFLVTGHHSTVHFSQHRFPGCVPNMPYAAYRPPRLDLDQPIDENWWIEVLPPWGAAVFQAFIFFFTDFHVETLGGYQGTQLEARAGEVFGKFRERLRQIARDIECRNLCRVEPYLLLHPDSIPLNVNI